MDPLRQVIAELAAARANPVAMMMILVSHSPSADSQNICSQICGDSLHSSLNCKLGAASSRCIMMRLDRDGS